jgi:hypothetical protein
MIQPKIKVYFNSPYLQVFAEFFENVVFSSPLIRGGVRRTEGFVFFKLLKRLIFTIIIKYNNPRYSLVYDKSRLPRQVCDLPPLRKQRGILHILNLVQLHLYR